MVSLQFTADCVVNIHQHLTSAAATRSLRVVKYRGSGFVEREVPFHPKPPRTGHPPKSKSLSTMPWWLPPVELPRP